MENKKLYRLIKYWNKYSSNKANFSNCSTEYKILDTLTDNTSVNNLLKLSEKYGLETKKRYKADFKNQHRYNKGPIGQAIKLREVKTVEKWNKKEVYQVYLGLIEVDTDGPLKPVENCKGVITDQQAYDIFNHQSYGVFDRVDIKGEGMIVIEGRNYFHDINLLGYSLEQFHEVNDVSEYVFCDEVFMCGDCNEWDYSDNGYTYNYRVIDCEKLGTSCGCFDSYCKENFADEYGDDSEKAIELDTATELEKEGKLEHLERFIGGMTDGRGGYYNGDSCDEGEPDQVLKDYKEKYPDDTFIFSHDESGQFQSYFSIWRVK